MPRLHLVLALLHLAQPPHPLGGKTSLLRSLVPLNNNNNNNLLLVVLANHLGLDRPSSGPRLVLSVHQHQRLVAQIPASVLRLLRLALQRQALPQLASGRLALVLNNPLRLVDRLRPLVLPRRPSAPLPYLVQPPVRLCLETSQITQVRSVRLHLVNLSQHGVHRLLRSVVPLHLQRRLLCLEELPHPRCLERRAGAPLERLAAPSNSVAHQA